MLVSTVLKSSIILCNATYSTTCSALLQCSCTAGLAIEVDFDRMGTGLISPSDFLFWDLAVASVRKVLRLGTSDSGCHFRDPSTASRVLARTVVLQSSLEDAYHLM